MQARPDRREIAAALALSLLAGVGFERAVDGLGDERHGGSPIRLEAF